MMPETKMTNFPEKILQQRLANLCLGMGWNSIHQSTMEILVDLQSRFIREIGRRAQSNAELTNHHQSNILDVQFALDQLRVDSGDLEMYLKHLRQCDAMLNCEAMPEFPAKSESNLNFLKPGSREVLVRKIHIQDYFPPMYSDIEDEYGGPRGLGASAGNSTTGTEITLPKSELIDGEINTEERKLNSSLEQKDGSGLPASDENLPFREIASVMMTSSGFISPAIQGRTAEARFDRSELEEGRAAILQAANKGRQSPESSSEVKEEKPKAKTKRKSKAIASSRKKVIKSSKEDPDFLPIVDEEHFGGDNFPSKGSRKRKVVKSQQVVDVEDSDEDNALLVPNTTKISPTTKKRGRPKKSEEKAVMTKAEEAVSSDPVAMSGTMDENLTLPPPPPHLQVETSVTKSKTKEEIKKLKAAKIARRKEKERKREERRKEKLRKKEERKKEKRLKLAQHESEKGQAPVPKLKIKEPKPDKPSKSDRKSRSQISPVIPPASSATEPSADVAKVKAKRGRKTKPKVKITLSKGPLPESLPPAAISGGIVTTQTVCHYFDAEGNEIWICPVCGKQEEDKPMVGCDGKGPDGQGCDDWYHFACVGIQHMPESEDWFCPKCAPFN